MMLGEFVDHARFPHARGLYDWQNSSVGVFAAVDFYIFVQEVDSISSVRIRPSVDRRWNDVREGF
jgi:hypothetical protein